jgi:hypothetical protein
MDNGLLWCIATATCLRSRGEGESAEKVAREGDGNTSSLPVRHL